MNGLNFNHVGEETLTVTSTAALLPRCRQRDGKGNYVNTPQGLPSYINPTHALIYVGGQPVRWRADGIAPDSGPGMGMYVPAGSYIDWTNPLGGFSGFLQQAQFCRAEGSTGNATLEISYFA